MSREDDIRQLINEHNRRLQKLKEKKAKLGIEVKMIELLTEE